MGNLLLIIIPAVCKERGSIFGDEDNCHTNGLAYTSISLAIGAICLWSYVYNIVRIYSEVSLSKSMLDKRSTERDPINFTKFPSLELLPLRGSSLNDDDLDAAELVSNSETISQVSILIKIKEHLQTCARKMNFRTLFVPPPTIGAIIGFTVATVPQLRKLFISKGAPLRIFEDTALLIGEAAIPTVTLILGANLLKGLKQSGMQVSLIVGIIVVRYVALPVIGILVVKCATHFGLLHSDPLFRFVLLLHYALPPSMNIGTMTQLFGAGEGEFSLIMLWTYSLASVSLTLWATFFMWLLA